MAQLSTPDQIALVLLIHTLPLFTLEDEGHYIKKDFVCAINKCFSNFNVHWNQPMSLVEMQILMQLAWGKPENLHF